MIKEEIHNKYKKEHSKDFDKNGIKYSRNTIIITKEMVLQLIKLYPKDTNVIMAKKLKITEGQVGAIVFNLRKLGYKFPEKNKITLKKQVLDIYKELKLL